MKKVILTASMLALLFINLKAQNKNNTDSSTYKSRKLKVEEINFVSGYYQQDGNNSAVTGGIGTEKLTDIANSIDLKLSRIDKKNNIHNLSFELGVDTYTSASSDKIDPATVSSASSRDLRVYPSANYSFNNTDKNFTLGGGISFSMEYDYTSIGSLLSFSKSSKDNNREISVKASAFLDTWKVILPIELRAPGYNIPGSRKKAPSDTKPRNSYNLGFELSQVINKNLQMAFLLDLAYQDGLLATSYQRVYFKDGSVKIENLPSSRFKVPFGIRANYFLGDRMVLRSYYRYYIDNWKVNAHTFSIEPHYKLTPFKSIGLLYRFYVQEGTEYFKPINQHALTDEFYSSDYDLSSFNSNMIGLNTKFTDASKGLLGIKKLNTIELRYGYYARNTGLKSHIVSLLFKFK